MQRSLQDRLYFVLIGTLAGLTMLLLTAPTAVVLIISFTGGITLKFPPPSWSLRWYVELLDSFEIIQPALTSLKVAALIDKPGDRKIEVQVDWAAFTVKESMPDRFLVGYGLDYAEHYRGLPYIGTIPRPERAGEGRTISIASDT